MNEKARQKQDSRFRGNDKVGLFDRILILVMNFAAILVLIISLYPSGTVVAQTPPFISAKLDSLYRARNYNELENYALRTLLRQDSLNVFDQAELHKYLGIVYIIQSREDEGREEFARWLKLDPKGYIDSFNFPPGIVQIYREVKSAMPPPEPKNAAVIQMEKWKSTPASAVKSLIIPGWGQFLQGKSPKGYYLFAAQSVCIAGALVSQHNFNLADRAYHQETEVSQFDAKYDRMNDWNKARWSFFAASLAVYIYTQTDFFMLPPNIKLTEVTLPNGEVKALLGFFVEF